MNHPRVPVRLLAHESLPGIAEALGNMDGWLLRDGAHRLVTRHEGTITVGRVGTDPSRVLADRAVWADPAPDDPSPYCSPLPDGGLAISTRQAVTVHEPDGTVRWEHRHRDWQQSPEAAGACTPDPAGRVLLATMAGPVGPDGLSAGDICRALDLATGEVLSEHVLPTFSATYAFQQFPDARSEVLLTASMGQDGARCLLVTYAAGGLGVRAAGTAEEPYVGLGADGVLVSQDVGGGYLCRTQDGADDVIVEARNVLPDEWVFVGYTPGFVDDNRILVVAAEEQWAEEGIHLLLDARTLEPVAELDYPQAPGVAAVPLGDGTWLTHDQETVQRWTTT
ncbi:MULTISPECIES: hypothetical protein [Streptomyces]|uniref:Uncharacterized protein n=1 Tax=Streptomyces sp. R33 TaxID=3238629 RepID=A0AB39YHT3_9ACTN|nr:MULTISPECIES: hypothetical protein [Streptomyces]KJY48037.1 hypothetical protein VR46_00070 [Streptomyces sp. NRRL S-444]KOY50380.1 hypothetical protein ADK59_37225 [Streptomyces sp. XY332]THA30651.1 hypothetical protein E6W17_37200 [Streptomyces sp. A1547]